MAKPKREVLISAAKELIKSQPKAGRREIAKDLRREYGLALRDSVILSLQREIYPKPQSMIYRRRNSLLKQGFTPKEAKQFSTLTFKNVSWFDKVRKEREKELRNLIKERGSKKLAVKDIRNIISDRYHDEGWELESGKADPWQMFRDMRAEAIQSGVWEETPRKKKPGKHHRGGDGQKAWSKGKIKEQRERWQERMRANQRISPAYLYGVKKQRTRVGN